MNAHRSSVAAALLMLAVSLPGSARAGAPAGHYVVSGNGSNATVYDTKSKLTWLRGSQADPSSEVRMTVGGQVHPIGYGQTVSLPRGGSGEIVVHDRTAPRSVNVGFHLEV